MEKGKSTPPEDITQQHYKGPSAYVAALGEGAMQTKFLTLGGLLVGGAAAFLAPKDAAKMIDAAQKAVDSAAVSPNALKMLGGKLGKITLQFGKEMSDFFTEIGIVKNHLGRMDKKRIATAIDGAIFTSAAASVLGAITGGGAGIASARAGRKQFETAKEQVLDMRQKLAQKQKEVDDLKVQMEDLKVQQAANKGLLKVSGDAEHPLAENNITQTDNADEPPAKNWRNTIAAQEELAEAADKDSVTKTTTAKELSEAPAKSYTESLGDKPAADWKQDIADKQTAQADQQLAL